MRIITNLRQLHRQFRKPVVTIGIFDGVHLGHKKILRQVAKEAKHIRGTSVVVTFNPHPMEVLDMIGSPPLLVSLRHRLDLIANEGIDVACVLNFSKTLAKRNASEFIKKIMIQKIGVHSIVIGSDFKFGRNQKGDIGLLKSFGKKFGFHARRVPLLRVRKTPVSSTRIRELIVGGKLKKASRLLGRGVSVLGTVIKGSKRGRILGYPTANIDPHHEAIPPSGVYAVYVVCEGKRYKGILNIGFRPTFDTTAEPTIEVHIAGFKKRIYGKDIEVIFVRKLRNEKKFLTKERLIKQIKIDEANAYMVL